MFINLLQQEITWLSLGYKAVLISMKSDLNIHLVFKALAVLFLSVYHKSYSGGGIELEWDFLYSFPSQSLCYAVQVMFLPSKVQGVGKL